MTEEEKKAKRREYMRRYYLANREKLRKAHRAYYMANSEHIYAKVKEWRAAHPDQAKKHWRKWQQANKPRLAAYQRKKRAEDPEFRARCIAKNAAYRERVRAEKREAKKLRDECNQAVATARKKLREWYCEI